MEHWHCKQKATTKRLMSMQNRSFSRTSSLNIWFGQHRRAAVVFFAIAGSILAAATPSLANSPPMEIHDRIAQNASAANNRVALTLDACGGAFDRELIEFLIRNRIPATLFATKKWLDNNPLGVATVKAHLDLFDIEDHGEKHIPAVIGVGKKVYGIPGQPDLPHLRQEVLEGARAVERATNVAAHWYRGATAEYDQLAVAEIRNMGFKIAGFSVNADAGATLKTPQIIDRLRHVQGGDVIIAHMNKPASDTAAGLTVGLAELRQRGLVFVRLDNVELVETR